MKNKISTITTPERLTLIIILVTGFCLRYYHVGFQSFWLDELYTVIGCDPGSSWKGLLDYLRHLDMHPPLFFVLEKIVLRFSGSSEPAARMLSVVSGTLGIWAIYLLGKEFYSRRLGLIAAAFTCINFYSIYYSQEARPYALVTLFATLSFLFLVRFIKTLKRKDCIFYAVFTLLMLYTHYFGIFVLGSQILIGIVFWIFEKNKKQFLVNFMISGLVIAIGFSPCLALLKGLTVVRSFWIPETDPGFAINFFYEYFGNTDLLKPFLLFLLLSCMVYLFLGFRNESGGIKERPLTFAFLVCSMWIFIGFFIPYLRSILVVPMLIPRYTIVLLPAFIIFLSLGVELIASQPVRYVVLTFFILISFTHIFFVQKYYSTVNKTQFRELANFVTADKSATYPIVTDITSWHQQYYLTRFGYKGTMLPGIKESTIDSVLHKSSNRYSLNGFWITGAHGEQKMPKEIYTRIDSSFILLKERNFLDAWAQLYVARNTNTDRLKIIDYRYFPIEQAFDQYNKKVVAIWNNKGVVSHPVAIGKGAYRIILLANGTTVAGVFPHIRFSINDKLLGAYNLDDGNEERSFEFKAYSDTTINFCVKMDNDSKSIITGEDRNVFINSIIIEPL